MTTEEILILCGQIAAVLAIAFLFYDAIRCIIKQRNFKLSITALSFLSLASILFLVGQFAFTGVISVILSIVALVFLVGYLICDILIVFGNIKSNKKNLSTDLTEESAESVTSSDEESVVGTDDADTNDADTDDAE